MQRDLSLGLVVSRRRTQLSRLQRSSPGKNVYIDTKPRQRRSSSSRAAGDTAEVRGESLGDEEQ